MMDIPDRIYVEPTNSDGEDYYTRGEWVCDEFRNDSLEFAGDKDRYIRYLRSTPAREHAEKMKDLLTYIWEDGLSSGELAVIKDILTDIGQEAADEQD